MAYAIIDDFRFGQDNRRTKVTARTGTLWLLRNAHINRGGEIEKRKALVSKYTLPANTFGMAATASGLYAFGSIAPPTMPSGVTYQRLQHPSSQAMSKVLQAEIFNGLLYVVAQFADASVHHFYNGTRVSDWYDGRARGYFEVTGGSLSAGVNKVTSITVNGVEVLSTAVDHTGTNLGTAAAVAAQINSFNSTPEYTATAIGSVVYVIAAAAAGAGPNGYEIVVTKAGDVTVGPITNMAGGQAAAGTFTPGTAVRTFRSKMYSTASSLCHFSKIDDPTKYTTDQTGAGFINMSNHAAGSEELVGLDQYYSDLAVFAKGAIQIWSMVSDPLQNVQSQILRNTGTSAPLSIRAVGEGDVFYLAKAGIRGLRAKDSSNSAKVAEIGAAIDVAVLEYLATLNQTQRDAAVSIVEPVDGSYWLAVGQRVYVYKNFGEINAWSEYDVGMTITDFAVLGSQLYARAGDVIYLYGGDSGAVYDASVVTVETPFIDGGKPATAKDFDGIDIALQGLWSVSAALDPEQPDQYVQVANVHAVTFAQRRYGLTGNSTHVALKLVHQTAEFAKISKAIVHYEGEDAD